MNAIYFWCVERIPAEDYEKWWYEMNQPLPGSEKKAPSPMVAEDEGADFLAAMRELTG